MYLWLKFMFSIFFVNLEIEISKLLSLNTLILNEENSNDLRPKKWLFWLAFKSN